MSSLSEKVFASQERGVRLPQRERLTSGELPGKSGATSGKSGRLPGEPLDCC